LSLTTLATRIASAVFLLVLPVLAAPVSAAQGEIVIKGSNTMVSLNQELARRFKAVKPNIRIVVEGKGSETGVRALMRKDTDLAAMSRPMREEEVHDFKSKFGQSPRKVPIAVDGIWVYVHASNPVGRLTVDQLRKIFAGEIRNWREVGGLDRRIDIYNRDRNSGTRAYMRSTVLKGGRFSELARDVSSAASLVNAVSSNPNAIGYSGVSYTSGARVLRLAARAGDVAVTPSYESVTSEAYPLSRSLYYYVHPDAPKETVQAYLEWVLSDDGQAVVTTAGFFPVPGAANGGSTIEASARDARPAEQQLTPENVRDHGFRVAVGLVNAKRAGRKKVTIIFGAPEGPIGDAKDFVLSVGDDAEVPLTLQSDGSLEFELRNTVLSVSTLRFAVQPNGTTARRYAMHLSDFGASD